MEHHI